MSALAVLLTYIRSVSEFGKFDGGVEGDEGYQACMADQNNRDAIKASIAAARVDGVTATPTFFLNGELMEQNARLSAVTFAAELDKALDAAGVAE